MFWIVIQTCFFPLKWEPVWWKCLPCHVSDLHLYLEWVRWHFLWFPYWLLSPCVFWHVCGLLFGYGKNGCTLCYVPEPVRNNFFFFFCYESQELQLYGFWHTYSCTCGPLLIGCIDRAIPQSLSWSRKAVILTSVSVSWMVPLGRVTCTNLKF